jgi:hypothetical protein
MLNVIPKTWSYTFSVMNGTEPVAHAMDLSWWRDKGELRIQDDIYTAHRDESSYVLESAAGVLARAERPRKWFRELVIEHSGRRYTLCAKSAFRRQLLLLEGCTQIGSISPEGLFTRKAAVKLPQALPLFLQVFIIWLAMTLWEDYAATAVAGGVAVSGP